MASYAKLNEDDAFLFRFWISSVLHTYENALYQRRVGLLDEDRWQYQLLSLSTTLRFPGVAQWWNAEGYRNFSPELVALVEEILGEEPERADRAE
jgi:hypothetical protein